MEKKLEEINTGKTEDKKIFKLVPRDEVIREEIAKNPEIKKITDNIKTFENELKSLKENSRDQQINRSLPEVQEKLKKKVEDNQKELKGGVLKTSLNDKENIIKTVDNLEKKQGGVVEVAGDNKEDPLTKIRNLVEKNDKIPDDILNIQGLDDKLKKQLHKQIEQHNENIIKKEDIEKDTKSLEGDKEKIAGFEKGKSSATLQSKVDVKNKSEELEKEINQQNQEITQKPWFSTSNIPIIGDGKKIPNNKLVNSFCKEGDDIFNKVKESCQKQEDIDNKAREQKQQDLINQVKNNTNNIGQSLAGASVDKSDGPPYNAPNTNNIDSSKSNKIER